MVRSEARLSGHVHALNGILFRYTVYLLTSNSHVCTICNDDLWIMRLPQLWQRLYKEAGRKSPLLAESVCRIATTYLPTYLPTYQVGKQRCILCGMIYSSYIARWQILISE
jgi:hypothetical protein